MNAERTALPALNRQLVGTTADHPGRWQYAVDFDKMEQTNLATQTTRRIRRFGMEEVDGAPNWSPASVGVLMAANGKPGEVQT